MCGIVGYIGNRKALDVLLNGLRRLEYRGYDSAGVALLEHEGIEIVKVKGRLSDLSDKVYDQEWLGTVGIGHTRWATHGRPSDENAHPHSDCHGDVSIVHNGIIENYQALKKELKQKGHIFQSETDTEVVSHLIEEYYEGDLLKTVYRVMERLEGSFALSVLHRKEPQRILCARKDNPLVIGLGEVENLIASDIPAILDYTRDILTLEDGEVAVVEENKVQVFNNQGEPIDKEPMVINWDAREAEKGGYDHFMLKEIHEQPRAVRETIRSRVDGQKVTLEELSLSEETLRGFTNIKIVACGTAYHAGLVGKTWLESLVRVPVEVDIASEFRYRNPLLDSSTLVLVISQSGETADTLAALRESKKRGAKVIAITNVVGSSVSREADEVIYTWAGPEIAVASTKAYVTQLVVLSLFATYMAQVRDTVPASRISGLVESITALPDLLEQMLESEEEISKLAYKVAEQDNAFFIGRALDWAVAEEGALKLKEISYIHAEAYAAGELKHGTLALITEHVPVICLLTQPHVYEKMLSNLQEVKARDATCIALAYDYDDGIEEEVSHVIKVPEVDPLLSPIVTVVPLQLLSYYAAVARGTDVDKPRNLAKSVTVE